MATTLFTSARASSSRAAQLLAWAPALAACGGAATTGAPAPLSSSTADVVAASPAAEVRVGDAPRRDCPAGLLEALAPRFAAAADEAADGESAPHLDACIPGRWAGQDALLVYASAAPPPDSQSEEPYPAWRLVATPGGDVLSLGPPSGGDWMVGAPHPVALVDLDGDGAHEIVEGEMWDPITATERVYRVTADGWIELARFVVASSAGEEADCAASWRLGPPDAAGARPMIVTSRGEVDHGDFPDEEAPDCLSPGEHVLRLVDGELVDESLADAELPDDEDLDADDE
jgi:hypothetical protein